MELTQSLHLGPGLMYSWLFTMLESVEQKAMWLGQRRSEGGTHPPELGADSPLHCSHVPLSGQPPHGNIIMNPSN